MAKDSDLYAYAGKILRVNLTNGDIRTEPTAKYAREWLGASGIAAKILYDELGEWVTPYDPANKLIFGAGPLVGTTAPGANKVNVSTLSPVTGGWGSSCSDSYFGGQLKCCGYDSIVIEGRAHMPVSLWIDNGKVEIRDACHLWGKTTLETLHMVRKEHSDPKLHIVSIGPAGENLVRAASIIQDESRAFGRCGVGCVMGSKNLKFIVAKGKGSVKVADPERFLRAVKEYRGRYKGDSVEYFRRYGTLGAFAHKQKICGIQYRNFQEARIPDEIAKDIDTRETCDKYRVAQVSFPGCAHGGCGRVMEITEGPYAGLRTHANQWEPFGSIQGRLGIAEPTFMVKANALCNELGFDVDLAGGAIGWAMECYERGIIDEKDTDGLSLKWGDAGVTLELIRKIAYREGFGNILAEGCARAADILGRDSSPYAIHIKKQDLYEFLRGSNAWALGVCTATRGGGHTTGAPVAEQVPVLNEEKAKEVYGVDNAGDARAYDGKAKMVTVMEVLHRVCNSFGVCIWNTAAWNVEWIDRAELAELYSAATGWETSVKDLEKLTMKQLNVEKALNLRFTDFDRKDDMPTQRALNDPVPEGSSLAGFKIDEAKWNKMLDEYYDLHDWDRETSYPTRKALVDLGLESVANDLESIGKLG